jgi:hypothetical protein
MEVMFHRLARLLVLLAAVQVLGGHWAVLQSVAWTGMLLKYSQQETMSVALEKTFSGTNPCTLCHLVRTGKQSEEKQDLAKIVLKLDAILPATLAAPQPPSQDCSFFVSPAHPAPTFFCTPKRPPRLV